MKVYLIASDDIEDAEIREAFPEGSREFGKGVWLVASKMQRSPGVSDLIGMDTTNRNTGLVIRLDDFYGFL